jgi:hypothetical protein
MSKKGINSKRLVDNLLLMLDCLIGELVNGPLPKETKEHIKKLVYWLIEQVRGGILHSSHTSKVLKVVKNCKDPELGINLYDFAIQFVESGAL